MVYQSEKTLGEVGDKVSEQEKEDLKNKIEALKEALKGQDIEVIKSKQDELQKTFFEVSTKLYQAAQASAEKQQPNSEASNQSGSENNGDSGDNVVDTDYKEV